MVLVVRYAVLFIALAGHLYAATDIFSESSLVTRFADTYYDYIIKKIRFTEIVYNGTSNSTQDYFSDRLNIDDETAEDFANDNVDNIRSHSMNSNITEVLADITGRAIRANFDYAVNGTIIYLYGRNVGEFLQINGVLRRGNIAHLARTAIKYEVEAIDTSPSDTDVKETLATSSSGFHNFLESKGLGDRELYAVLVTLYADNFYLISDGGNQDLNRIDYPPFRVSDAVVRFANLYSSQVMKDEQLSEAFKIDDVSTEQAVNITEQKVRENGKDSYLLETLVELVSRAVTNNYPRASNEAIVQFYGEAIAEQLQLFGDLTSDTITNSVEELVDQCIKAQRAAIGDTTDVSPEEVMGRVIQGLMDFLSNMGDLNEDKFPPFVTLYSKVYYRFP